MKYFVLLIRRYDIKKIHKMYNTHNVKEIYIYTQNILNKIQLKHS